MASFEQSIQVQVPVHTAYNQWTQFEMFPYFMEGVREVKQVSDTRLHWQAEIAGRETEWDAKITEQYPDQRIAWESISGAKHNGVVTFHRVSDDETHIVLHIDYEPQGVVENVGAALGVVERRLSGDLERFKHFIESGGKETGGWRGTVAEKTSAEKTSEEKQA